MNRIMPDEVVAAYQKIGKKAKQRVNFTTDQSACCGGVAVGLAQGLKYDHALEAAWNTYVGGQKFWDVMQEKYGNLYICGFMAGFDGAVFPGGIGERYTVGYADGQAALAAVKHLLVGV